jgi:hypothetical protein
MCLGSPLSPTYRTDSSGEKLSPFGLSSDSATVVTVPVRGS